MTLKTRSKWVQLAIIAAFALLGVALLVLPMNAAFAAQDGTDGDGEFADDVVTATTTVNLRIRSGPGLEYEILATLPAGTVVGFTGFTDASGDWVQVDAVDGPLGWVFAAYLSNVPDGLQVRPADLPEDKPAEEPMEAEEAAVSFSSDVVTATTLYNLNVRTGPGTEYARVETLPAGTVVGFTGFTDLSGDWVQIDSASSPVGWVAAEFLSNVPDGLQVRPADLPEEEVAEAAPEAEEEVSFSTDVVTATTTVNLNLRSGPGTEFEVLETLPNGTVVGFTGFMDASGDWVQVDPAAGQVGWVASQYLSNVPDDLQVWEG